MKIKEFLKENRILIVLIIIAILIRLPWLYTTIERDEGAFGFAASKLLSGQQLYKEIPEGKFPGIMLIYASTIFFFGKSIIAIRLLNNLLFLISIPFIFEITRKLYNRKIAITSVIFYIILMNIPIFEAQLAMSESFLIFFIILTIYFLIRYTIEKKISYLILSILFTIVAVSIRISSIILFLLIFIEQYKNNKKVLTSYIIFILAGLIIFSTLIYFNIFNLKYWLYYNILYYQVRMANYIPINYMLLIFLEAIFFWTFLIIGIILLQKTKRKEDKFCLIWFSIFFILCIIPPGFGHYFIQIIPQLSIIAAIGYHTLFKKIGKSNKIFFIIFISLLCSIMIFLWIKHYPNYNFKWRDIEIEYSDLESYTEQIEISRTVEKINNSEGKILMWGQSLETMWLSGRYKEGVNFNCLFPELYSLNRTETENQILKGENLEILIISKKWDAVCYGFDKPIFYDYIKDMKKVEMYNMEIYYK
jgi:4-amino-4-deoxy-L-arabinose transferase-like glycosyltransferase